MKVLKIKPGPKVGNILEKLFEKVISKEIPNEKDKLLNKLKTF